MTDITRLLKSIKETKSGGFELEQGEYFLREKDTVPIDLVISNHRNAIQKRAAFMLKGKDNLTIDGNGSKIISDGFLIPVAIINSKNITLKNFTFDLAEPLFAEGRIVKAGKNFVDIRFLTDRYRIKEGKLFFTVYGKEYAPLHVMEFNTKKKLFCPTGDLAFGGVPELQSAEQLQNGNVRIRAEIKTRLTVGNILIFRFGLRDNPTIVINNSQSIKLENVTIHSSHAMGLIAQRCENIVIKNFTVEPKNHCISLNADALHFVNCKGNVEISDSRFEYQLDDALNVHGVYGIVDEILSTNKLKLSLKDAEQKGFRYLEKGDEIAFIHSEDMLSRGFGKVKEISYDGDSILLETEEDIPNELKIGWGIENVTFNCYVSMKNCYLHGNRARGILISTPCGADVSENVFDSIPGSVLLVSGDMHGWFESGSAKNIHFADNTVLACGYVPMWGKWLINVCPELREYREDKFYHCDIYIENNQFEQCAMNSFLFAQSVNGLLVKGNKFDFKPIVQIGHSQNIKLQNGMQLL